MSPAGGGAPPERPERARPKPPPARQAGGAAPEGRRGRTKPGEHGPRRGAGRPTPVRTLPTSADASSAAEPAVEERSVEIGGEPWRVRVLGRSRAGGAGPGADLLLLGFWPAGSTADAPEREALVVAGGIDMLEPVQLSRAMAAAREPPDPDRPRPFFEDGRRGRRS